ncbi:hypothetical protein [Salimicrobium flavidum]|uniref:Uncharacterized protein n=1 Tax=Salimicrobium flavidum TaxID=570947 RepID=A0A1N7J9K3_9BACI|nr:hypothetical protein [Salimicrobium flavidum]SIS45916.1 hypothetical protein SAMN05421687_104199 [Salimicrobium flavidum]
MKKSKVILFNIIGIIVIGLLIIGFALLTNVAPGQSKGDVEMNAEEKAMTEALEPSVQMIFDDAEHFFVTLEEELAHIDIELARTPDTGDDRLLSGFIVELLREDIVAAGEVTLHYTGAPGMEEKERF